MSSAALFTLATRIADGRAPVAIATAASESEGYTLPSYSTSIGTRRRMPSGSGSGVEESGDTGRLRQALEVAHRAGRVEERFADLLVRRLHDGETRPDAARTCVAQWCEPSNVIA